MALFGKKSEMPRAEDALAGRAERMPVPPAHFVNGHPLEPPFPEGLEQAVVAMGCFWGAERVFWQAEGVYTIRLTVSRPPGFRPLFLPGATAPLAERSFEFVVIDSNKRDTARPVAWENVLEIDPTSPRWWDRLPAWTQLRRIPGLNRGPLGSIRAASINHPLGRFIERNTVRSECWRGMSK